MVCQWIVISKEAWYYLGGCPRREGEKFSRRPIGPSENYTMHKVETAGHAGTELGLSRLPVLKLLTGRAAIVGAQGSQLEGRSQTRGRCAGRGSPSP